MRWQAVQSWFPELSTKEAPKLAQGSRAAIHPRGLSDRATPFARVRAMSNPRTVYTL